ILMMKILILIDLTNRIDCSDVNDSSDGAAVVVPIELTELLAKGFLIVKRVGNGKFGTCYEARMKKMNANTDERVDCVVKIIPAVDRFHDNTCEIDGLIYPREILFLQRLAGRKGVVKMIDFFRNDGFAYIVMEAVDNAITLSQLIGSKRGFVAIE